LKQPQDLSVLALRSATHDRRTNLLASSPDDFADSFDICYDPLLTSGSELWTTSVGVKGTVSVVEIGQNNDSTSQAFIVLECHPECSPDISLNLLMTSNPPAADDNMVYSVDAMQSVQADGSFTRLGEITFLGYADVHCQSVTIALQPSMDPIATQRTMPHHQLELRSQAPSIHSPWQTQRDGKGQDFVDESQQTVLASALVESSQPDSGTALLNQRNEASATPDMHQKKSYSPPTRERLVVVKKGYDIYDALRITTYGALGVAAPGMKGSNHGIVYFSANYSNPTMKEETAVANE
jgi:hypothetical protein